MAEIRKSIRFLSKADLDTLGLGMGDIIDILEEAFRAKAAGKVMMPPKIFFHRLGPRFYSSMVSASPALGYAGCKWQSGDPDNPGIGLPYIQGLYILTEDATGQMCAIMDSEWITGQRTAAASGLVIGHLAKDRDRTLGILGCGLQGRKHLEAVHAARPQFDECVCYDLLPERQERFIAEMTAKFGFDSIVGMSGPEEVARSCDVLVTGGPIQKDRKPVIQPTWIKAGMLVVTIDYDSYVTDEAIRSMDLVLTDDYGQIEDARRNEGKFPGMTRVDSTVAELVTHGKLDQVVVDQPGTAGLGHDASASCATGAKIKRRDHLRRKISGVGLYPVSTIVEPQADESDITVSTGEHSLGNLLHGLFEHASNGGFSQVLASLWNNTAAAEMSFVKLSRIRGPLNTLPRGCSDGKDSCLVRRSSGARWSSWSGRVVRRGARGSP